MIEPSLFTAKLAIIRKVDIPNNTAWVSFPLTQSDKLIPVPLPVSWRGPKGEISLGYPQKGTSVYCSIVQGGSWVIVGWGASDSSNKSFDNDGQPRVDINKANVDGRWSTLITNDIHIIADPKIGILAGDSHEFIQADPLAGIFSTRFDQNMSFTEGHRHITGPILRDTQPNNTRGVLGSALTDHSYNKNLRKIGLDPKTLSSKIFKRNPGFVESRSEYYEFEKSYKYTNDKNEISVHEGNDIDIFSAFRRYDSRADTLNLSLDEPNLLLESIIGTVVDIYGNILDINKNVLPNGIIDNLSFNKSQDNSSEVFKKLRSLVRKSIAYHLELNSRKEGFDLPNYNDNTDYARKRSKFSLDIDKEGQFKINVPSSSEEGNISLLVRHDNFSAIKGQELNVDRGQFIRNGTDNTDIKIKNWGKGSISLKSNDESLQSYASPIDRVDGNQIKLGTGFHDITTINYLHTIKNPIKGYPDSVLNKVPPITNIVSSEIIISGTGANAGGRSGTISTDGMISLSLGANTIDRQSLWLDSAGGMVFVVGRDKFDRSLSAQFDGDVIIQIGSTGTVSDDSRFPDSVFNNGRRDGALDIRILNSGSLHIIRIDNQGLQIHTPQRIDIVSEGDIRLKSVRGNMYLDAESIFLYSGKASGGRLVNRSLSTIG